MSEPIINNPHALYCNGELVGVILNPDPVTGGAGGLLEALNDADPDSVFDMVTIPMERKPNVFDMMFPTFSNSGDWGKSLLLAALQALGVKSEIVPSEREDEDEDV